jgi:NAD+ kinase
MYRPTTPEAIRQARELARWLLDRGLAVYAAPGQELIAGCRKVTARTVGDIEWAIALGGDGTYLNAVRLLEGRQVPILGVNMGSLGFLTPFRAADLYQAATLTMDGQMEFRPRSQLHVCVKRKGRADSEHVALNDAVLERGSSTHLINIAIQSQRHLVAETKADALIIASPTGSTAYNLAAGGPILHPDVRAIVVTPVCPHALTSRPLIFPDDQELSFRVLARDKRAVLIVDGAHCGEIGVDDEVVVVRNSIDHLMIRKPETNYFNLLREKLRFGERD